MISLLTPTRGRPDSFKKMVESADETAQSPIEVIAYTDKDDTSYVDLLTNWKAPVRWFASDQRQPLSKLFQMCYEKANGQIFMSCDDDVIFRTWGWDMKVNRAFAQSSDKIILVYGDDGSGEEKTHAPHPFIHQNWVDAVGRYLPSHFRGDFCDTWLNDLADGVGRKVKIDAYFEHMHPAFNKGVMDKTRQEKINHHFKHDMPKVYYEDTVEERQADIKKLQRYIDEKA